ncbi:N-formylglutamate amidohydrolase [Sphingomonas sp. CGMCC 1.13654]|uniref:N-formylglutamate amidohydrolase n=1 Tax=Sphingomonas chungangi TaxID=2683589 RepID=A0A838L7J8_9SPHN|nr:N-formylglutamate amidohydrolase [Sphingomonas chungangi]MBA2934997.1 N-formylglutamate amidohydrolase [Sphingomonas chungangi]MVW54112.1 N-formylglutamate amidohydrolase [Sphingomonas chungangi]
MTAHPPEPSAYARLGQAGARSPLVVAVPHAGRHYPPEMLAAARLPQSALETIEDRHADLLVADAVQAGAVAIVARMARAYVDLNRDEREIDPVLLGERAAAGTWLTSPKVAGGLGAIPSRIAAGGTVWARRFDAEEIEARMTAAHRPYHAAIGQAMDEAVAVHGIAILIDCHSMPPLAGRGAHARLVVGDRHGRSAEPRFVAAAIDAAKREGLTVARNHPYAGGHTLDRHGNPREGRHAIQIELDRSLYLDAQLRMPTEGLSRARRIIAAIALALEDEARGTLLAAE